MPSLSVLVILSLALNAVQASYEDPWVASKFPKRQKGPEMPTVHRNLLLLQGDCGDVCDTSKDFPIRTGKYFDTMTKEIECDALFDSPFVDVPPHRVEEQHSIGTGMVRPTYVSEVPDEILKLFAYDGKTDLIGGYHDRSGYARNPDWHGVYSEDSLTRVLELIKKGDRTVPEAVQKAIDEYFPNNVKDGQILILGAGPSSHLLSAILLDLGAAHVTIFDYARLRSTHPKVSTLSHTQFKQSYLAGKLPQFDAFFDFQFFNRIGLGRFGEGLNPWSDRINMGRAYCLSKPGARGLIYEPSGVDAIIYNQGRIYGPLQMSHLVANWNVLYSDFKVFARTDLTERCKDEDGNILNCFKAVTVVEKPRCDSP